MGKFEKQIVVYGDPKAQKRHRSTRSGKFIRQYDPSSKDKEDFLLIIQNERPHEPIKGAIMLEVHFYFARPKSHYKTGKNAGLLREDAPVMNAHKPDVDNLLKFLMDAMNGIFYKDDGQVVTIICNKFYSPIPRTKISISEL